MNNLLAIDPHFFGTPITWYAVCILIGVVLAVWLGIKEGKKIGIPSDVIYWGVLIILPCSIAGARLWYILFNLDESWSFSKIIGLEGGLAGLAIQGGVIAALISIFIYCKVKSTSHYVNGTVDKLYRILDLVAPGFLIGQICGRWGNFFNQELYGPKVENVELFKNLLPGFITDNMYISGAYRHPVFLYESALNFVGLIIMLLLRRKCKKLNSGDLICFYLSWYGVVRIITESMRLNSGVSEPLMAGPIPVSILLSIIFIVVGVTLFIVKRFVGPKNNYLAMLKEVKETKLDTILFDLDGTLLDTKPLIDRSFIHTFEHFRPDYQLTDEELDSFFGPTLHQTFSKYGKDEAEVNAMIAYYREFNIANHDSMVKAMVGAKDIVTLLHKKGYNIGVVSSKKTDLLCHGLELFGLLDKMDIVIGADEVKNHKPAPDGILLAVEQLKKKKEKANAEFEQELSNKNKFVAFFIRLFRNNKNIKNVAYVGDTLNDMAAAKAAGVQTIGCLYIKNPEIMLEANPDFVIEKLNDILKIVVE